MPRSVSLTSPFGRSAASAADGRGRATSGWLVHSGEFAGAERAVALNAIPADRLAQFAQREVPEFLLIPIDQAETQVIAVVLDHVPGPAGQRVKQLHPDDGVPVLFRRIQRRNPVTEVLGEQLHRHPSLASSPVLDSTSRTT